MSRHVVALGCAVLGVAALLLDVWAVFIVYEFSRGAGTGSVVHPWLWFGLPHAAGLALVVCAYLLRSHDRNVGAAP